MSVLAMASEDSLTWLLIQLSLPLSHSVSKQWSLT